MPGKNQPLLPPISHLGWEDGFSCKQVNCGVQDSKGFIWFGTSHGLQRYDGQHFRLFTKEKNKLQDNNVVRIVEDNNQVLWILYGLAGTDSHSAGKVDLLDLNSYRVMSLTEKFGSKLPFTEFSINTICKNEIKEMIIAGRTPELKRKFIIILLKKDSAILLKTELFVSYD